MDQYPRLQNVPWLVAQWSYVADTAIISVTTINTLWSIGPTIILSLKLNTLFFLFFPSSFLPILLPIFMTKLTGNWSEYCDKRTKYFQFQTDGENCKKGRHILWVFRTQIFSPWVSEPQMAHRVSVWIMTDDPPTTSIPPPQTKFCLRAWVPVQQ